MASWWSQDIAGDFAVNAATGKKLWERNEVEAATLVGGGEGIAILSGAMVVAIDGATGDERWRMSDGQQRDDGTGDRTRGNCVCADDKRRGGIVLGGWG